MMDTIDYEPLVKKEPPEDLTEWVLQHGGLQQEYLIYKAGREYEPLEDRWRPAVEVTCSACGRTFLADKMDAGGCSHAWAPAPFGWRHPTMAENVISGMDSMCPFCGAEARVQHVGQISKRGIDDYAYTTEIYRVPVEGGKDRLVVQDWQTCRIIEKNGHSWFHTCPWTAWVVEEKKIVRLTGYTRYFSTLMKHDLEQRKTFLDDYGKMKFLYPWDPAVLEGTTAENSKLDKYIDQGGECLVAYLALWRKRPTIENLVMQGCGGLVEELIAKEQETSTYQRRPGIPKLKEIDWKEKQPNRMLHMNREEFRLVGRTMTAQGLKLLIWARENHIPVQLPEGLKLLEKQREYGCSQILGLAGPEEFWRTMRYLDHKDRDYTTLRDYRRMAASLEMDLENSQVRWPKDLKAAHDKVMKLYARRKDEILQAGFSKRAEALAAYSWSRGGILIRPCASEAELRNEGKVLHHCVATYAEDHATGKTAIFFVRKAEAPKKPWYTLELDEKDLLVKQNRGLRNCARTPEIQAFEDEWLAWLRSGQKKETRKRKKKGATAA